MGTREHEAHDYATVSFDQVKEKHSLTYTDLVVKLARGIMAETKQVNDKARAREIALIRISESPEYYTTQTEN
jgi:hypothetical protein